jgi:hypothetical protein
MKPKAQTKTKDKEVKEKKEKTITPKTIVADFAKIFSKAKKGDRLYVVAVSGDEMMIQADSISRHEVALILRKITEDML